MGSEQADVSLQTLGCASCELRIDDHTLHAAQLESRCPLDNGLHTAPSRLSARRPVGRLDLLPTELIQKILLALDVPTLTDFRRVNHRAMDLVDSLFEYQTVMKHCPNILRAIVSIDAKAFAFRLLYDSLFITTCSTCGRFGGYLYLVTCCRASTRTGLSREDLEALPHVRSLPGRYTAAAKLSKERMVIIDRRAVRRLDRADNSGLEPLQDFQTREPRGFMSIISAPYFTDSGQRADWGLHCRRCKSNTDPANNFRHQVTRDGLVAHMQQEHEEMGA